MSIKCRYYNQGFCSKKSQCEYLHPTIDCECFFKIDIVYLKKAAYTELCEIFHILGLYEARCSINIINNLIYILLQLETCSSQFFEVLPLPFVHRPRADRASAKNPMPSVNPLSSSLSGPRLWVTDTRLRSVLSTSMAVPITLGSYLFMKVIYLFKICDF